MKNIFKVLFVLLIFTLALCFPSFIIESAKYGLKLWYLAVLPALFPYMVISNYIIMSGISNYLSVITAPLTALYRINKGCAASIISGILFGYPACASSAVLSCQKGLIGKDEASFCACAFNNISPSFIIGYFCVGVYKDTTLIIPVIAVFYISMIISSFVVRIAFFRKLHSYTSPSKNADNTTNPIDSAVIKAIYNAVKLGGYIVIFAIAALAVARISGNISTILCGLIEITTGISRISVLFEKPASLVILLPLLSFGGISGIFQTFGIDTEHIIDRKKYIYSKITSMIICLIISYLTVYVLKIM